MADGKSGSRHARVIDPYGSAQDANACPRSLRWFAQIEGRVIPWQSSTTSIIVIVVIVLVAAIAVVGYRVAQQKRSVRLREQYGPEYDRALDQADSQRDAEAELRERSKRHEKLELRSGLF